MINPSHGNHGMRPSGAVFNAAARTVSNGTVRATGQDVQDGRGLVPFLAFSIFLLTVLMLGALWRAQPVQAQAADPTQLDPAQLGTLQAEPAYTGTALLMSQATEAPVPPFVPGDVLVGLKGELGGAAVWGAVNATQVDTLDLRGTEGVTGYRLQVEPGTEWAVVEQLRQMPEVVFAELNWLARIAQAPTDAIVLGDVDSAVEASLQIADRLYPEQWYLQRVGLARGWQAAFSRGSLANIEVAVLDTGVDFAHPDLADRLLPGRNYLVPGTAPADDNGHGTHITGLIAATADGRGMVGAGWRVTILPLKVLGAGGSGLVTYVAQAIRDAADGGADIINLSLQIPDDSFVLRSAVNYAAGEGALLIASVGNCSVVECPVPVRYPAAYDNVLGIAATTYYDTRAWYSATGDGIDLAAPGGGSGFSMLSTWSVQASATSCPSGQPRSVDGGLYCYVDGTSMAAAVATGAAALVWSMQPSLSAEEVRDILLDSAAPLSGNRSEIGEGRLDVARAAHYAAEPTVLLSLTRVDAAARQGDAPIEIPLRLENPSLEPVTWLITPTVTNNWFGVAGDATGSVRYDEPVETSLVLTPANLGVGNHLGQYWVTTRTRSGATFNQPIYVDLTVYGQTIRPQLFTPLMAQAYQAGAWEQPGFTARTAYSLGSNGSLAVTLPFTFTIGARNYTDLSIGADGVVALPATSFLPQLPARCLANNIALGTIIYGWWTDLNLTAPGARISTFQPDADRFVIEYNQASIVGSSERVSFQIVLHVDGQIQLNYGEMPAHSLDAPVVVGVSTQDGRFYNQVACWTGRSKLGTLPESYQSLVIHPEELF